MEIVLETERLLFRPHLAGDLDEFCAMEMDANVRRYAGGNPRSREEAEKRFPRDQFQKLHSDRLAVWATIFKAENRYIGRCGLYPHLNGEGKAIPGEAVIAFYIAFPYWGRGFAMEAGKAFVHFGFHGLGLERIVATVQKGNDASVHILQKLGLAIVSVEEGHRTFYHFALQNEAVHGNETQR
jgi:ribosomal-protein-alanine N-acetyltransferase